jgi:hypothetical protein
MRMVKAYTESLKLEEREKVEGTAARQAISPVGPVGPVTIAVSPLVEVDRIATSVRERRPATYRTDIRPGNDEPNQTKPLALVRYS